MTRFNKVTNSLSKTGQSPAKEIALEFDKIAKLSKNKKDDEAWRAANNLYSKYPNEATPNFIIALILKDNGQMADALPYAEAAAKFAPSNARYLVFLGKLYVDLGIVEEATAVLHKAFNLDKSIYQAPWALGVYYLKSGQGRRALPFFERALSAAPIESKADIIFDQAMTFRAVGNVEEAESNFKKVMNTPRFRIPALTESVLLRKNTHTSEYAAQISEELNNQDVSDTERSALLLSLGRLHENGKDYDNAFLNFEKSRKLLKSTFSMKNFVLQIKEISSVLKPEVFEKFEAFGHESAKPIFVVGMPRSGTTMTEQIIASHSQAEGVGELDRIPRMASGLSSKNGLQEILDTMVKAGPAGWKTAPLQYLSLINTLAPDARRVVDKLPQNFLQIGFIHLCFPNAKIIHCKRNPVDNFVSAFQNSMSTAHGYAYDQKEYGEYYINYLQLMDYWKSVLPDSIYESDYEVLTANPEQEIRNMLEFLDLPWEEACLKFNERESTVRTFSHSQVRNPINTSSVARWKNYEKHLAPIISVLENGGIRI